ncbi:hypothetical protein LJ656_34395 [Paraburkholderia sp. MMS20-SJTR3]|uniref:Uncharacterized protein n=1 Tax=Paraburkholderia sejongensis TaxID=2886946 RepID=A0ABS8K637_9BURK|nr:hypothetical protein [Paraburkholderia sp. MMS20-SJTR3]MCC8397634.1 hypothetical protein [Paraburkholderia sp. MMS20-SJTR3]
MKTFSHLETMGALKRYAIFCVPTKQRGDVWMRVSESERSQSVVEVDAARFVNAWRGPKSSHPEIAHLDEVGWRNDYKFHDAEEGFESGWGNPVPLAEVNAGFWLDDELAHGVVASGRFVRWVRRVFPAARSTAREPERHPYVSFTNGITRTIWLLVAGAERFPVMCGKEDAAILHHIAGARESTPCPVLELVPDIGHLERLDQNRTFHEKLKAHGLPIWAA